MRGLFIFLILIFSVASSHALPQYQSLFESPYGFKAQCVLCHVQEEVNPYGRFFARNGSGRKALLALETMDVDKDGHMGLEEIQARSNPGYSLSTPQSPGDWLAERVSLAVPDSLMRQAFPKATGFELLKRELKPEEKERVLRGLDASAMEDADYFAVLFVAREGKNVLGAASYVGVPEISASGREEHVFLLAVNPNGKILKLLDVRAGRPHLRKNAFLRQFKNLWPEGLAKIKFSKDASAGLKESFLRQISKYARLVDAVLPP